MVHSSELKTPHKYKVWCHPMTYVLRTIIFIPVITLFYLFGRFVLFDLFQLDSLLYQSLLELGYLTIAGLVSLLLSTKIVDEWRNNREP